MDKDQLIEKLRNQAYWCNQLADKLERGESIEDYLWTVDIPELKATMTIDRKEREVA